MSPFIGFIDFFPKVFFIKESEELCKFGNDVSTRYIQVSYTGKPYDRLVRSYTGDGRVIDNYNEAYAIFPGGYYKDGAYYRYITDYQGNNVAVLNSSGGLVQSTDYYPYGEPWREPSGQPWLYSGNERLRMDGINEYDFNARRYNSALGCFTTWDPLCEKRPWESPYAFCGGDPVNRSDNAGRQWEIIYYGEDSGTIILKTNFYATSSLTFSQIENIQRSISIQFNKMIKEASSGSMNGVVVFSNDDPSIEHSLTLIMANSIIGGLGGNFTSIVNCMNNQGDLRDYDELGVDAVHEFFHTLRLDHPFEVTQTDDTRIIKQSAKSFLSTSSTYRNMVNNVMSYPFITIDGVMPGLQNSLSPGQLDFIINEIGLQKMGFGHYPKYREDMSIDIFNLKHSLYYENYWNTRPGTKVQ
ncbi:MAG: hypothetical protein K2H01_01415 [Ruminococcus sp.]|nr:hypothetical protein [Ruminococcus sp.]